MAVAPVVSAGPISCRLPSINSYDGMMMLLTAAAVLGAIFVGFSWHRLSEMHSPRVVFTDATGERAQIVEVQQ